MYYIDWIERFFPFHYVITHDNKSTHSVKMWNIKISKKFIQFFNTERHITKGTSVKCSLCIHIRSVLWSFFFNLLKRFSFILRLLYPFFFHFNLIQFKWSAVKFDYEFLININPEWVLSVLLQQVHFILLYSFNAFSFTCKQERFTTIDRKLMIACMINDGAHPHTKQTSNK